MSQRSNYSTPRWVKVFGIILIILLLLVAVVLVTDVGGPHGPRRHLPSGDATETPSGDAGEPSSGAGTSLREQGVQLS